MAGIFAQPAPPQTAVMPSTAQHVFLVLMSVFALATICGVIQLLLRRSLGRYLIVAAAVIALLTYGGVFIAGARVAWIVHALPLLPVSSAVLVLLPRTKDWLLDA